MGEIITATPDRQQLAAYVREHAPAAQVLEELTFHLDPEQRTVWLDAPSGTVWHTYAELDGTTWYLEREPAAEALGWIRQLLEDAGVFERLARPTLYREADHSQQRVEMDEDAMTEFYDVELTALQADLAEAVERGHLLPDLVDRAIRRRINAARGEVARLASLRAHHLRRSFGSAGAQRGWQTEAARAIGVTKVAVGNLLADDDARAVKRRTEADLANETTGSEA